MKVNFRKNIIGKKITDVKIDDEGFGISVNDSWHISVWSDATLYKSGIKMNNGFSKLIGLTLLEFKEDSENECLIFSEGYKLLININLNESNLTEAMMLTGPENLIVVWND